MEVFGLVVFTIIYFVLFEWAFNSNYKMYTFGGVEGRARAHLDNALWFFIFAPIRRDLSLAKTSASTAE